jgi:hypothetical protein
MGTKLAKNSLPSGHSVNDFQCFGPPAAKDGDFLSAKIADLGCFTQDGKDSNKYYHGAVVKSKVSSRFGVYFEWGRTGATNVSYQYIDCDSEADAQDEFNSQLMSKNAKRGEWIDIGGIRTLRAKSGKDCYLVRPMAKRGVGLPDGRSIGVAEQVRPKSVPIKSGTPSRKVDQQTIDLMKDLNVATVQYTRTNIVGGAVPAQSAIDEARTFLIEAEKRLLKVGANIDNQLADTDLKQITYALYSRVPKVKPVNAPEATWILSSNNILGWRSDLDAFEAALAVQDNLTPAQQEHDPFDGMQIDMEWVNPSSDLGRFLYTWWPKATANRHGGVGNMKIRNAWKLERHEDRSKIEKAQAMILADKPKIMERPPFQPSERNDVVIQGGSAAQMKMYHDTNTTLLFHGTRSVNVSGIMRKALLLPKQLVGVVITGAMFGPGLYFADDWKKSAGYTSLRGSYWSAGGGSVKGRGAFMFAADVVLGEPHVAKGPSGYTKPPSGHCVYGKAGYSGVQNNEWIIFNGNQNKLKYLIEFEA